MQGLLTILINGFDGLMRFLLFVWSTSLSWSFFRGNFFCFKRGGGGICSVVFVCDGVIGRGGTDMLLCCAYPRITDGGIVGWCVRKYSPTALW